MKYHSKVIALSTLAFVLFPNLITLAKNSTEPENLINNCSEKTTTNKNVVANSLESDRYTGIVKKIDNIAAKITVRIATNNNPNYATGVIIANRDNTYYLVTANYAVNERQSYRIITPEGKIHQINNQNIQLIENSNFAVLSFQSVNTYDIATIAAHQQNRQWIFISGFVDRESQNKSDRILTSGTLFPQREALSVTKDSSSLATFKTPLVYTNDSYMGMGGGAVLDSQGRLIGINQGNEGEIYLDDEGDYSQYNLGYSLGTSIQDLLSSIKNNKTDLKIDWLTIDDDPPNQLSSSEIQMVKEELQIAIPPNSNQDLIAYLNYGNQLWRYQKYSAAIAAFKKAIDIKPNFDKTYYGLGRVYLNSQDYQEAVTVFKKAIALNDKPYFYWRRLGQAYDKLEQYSLALDAYDRAILKHGSSVSDDYFLYQERQKIADKLVSQTFL